MNRRVIVANLWDRATVVSAVRQGDPDPSPDQLDAIAVKLTAGNGGVKPRVRVVEEFHLSSFDAGGDVPDIEDMLDGGYTMPPAFPGRFRERR